MTGRQLDRADRAPLLRWMIFTGLSFFGAVLLWRFGLIRQMVMADRTYISSAIVLFYVATSVHCLMRLLAVSREEDAARAAARLIGEGEGIDLLPKGLVAAQIRDLVLNAGRNPGARPDPGMALRSLAARLRGSNQFGAFAGDTLMKLGLVGTIVGFIMMLAPIADIDTADKGAIKSSMNLMSEGMAVAMYTTLVGLVGSILVRIQYYMLEDATAKLFTFAMGLVETAIASLPAREADSGG
jgi:MotA/TolQ/ExbB proton channel family